MLVLRGRRGRNREEGRYLEEAVEELLIAGRAYHAGRGVDVLLTSQWGAGAVNLVAPKHRPFPRGFQGQPPTAAGVVGRGAARGGGATRGLWPRRRAEAQRLGADTAAAAAAADSEADAAAAEGGMAAAAAAAKAAAAKNAQSPPADDSSSGSSSLEGEALSPAVQRLCCEMSPRYHFAGGQRGLGAAAVRAAEAAAATSGSGADGADGDGDGDDDVGAKKYWVAGAFTLPPYRNRANAITRF